METASAMVRLDRGLVPLVALLILLRDESAPEGLQNYPTRNEAHLLGERAKPAGD